MKTISPYSFILMGLGLIPVAHIIMNPLQKTILLIASITLHAVGLVKVFQARRQRKL